MKTIKNYFYERLQLNKQSEIYNKDDNNITIDGQSYYIDLSKYEWDQNYSAVNKDRDKSRKIVNDFIENHYKSERRKATTRWESYPLKFAALFRDTVNAWVSTRDDIPEEDKEKTVKKYLKELDESGWNNFSWGKLGQGWQHFAAWVLVELKLTEFKL